MTDEKIRQVITLSEEEVAARAQSLAAKEIELRGEEDTKREKNRKANLRIKGIKAAIAELADQVKTRTMTVSVERQPGLFDDGPPEGEIEEDDDEDDQLAGDHESEGEAGAPEGVDDSIRPAWTTGPNPAPVADDSAAEPPPGTEVTDPGAMLGPEPPPKGRRGRKATEAAP